MKNKRRDSLLWKARYTLAGWLNHVVWALQDCHDSWMIDYQDDEGRKYGCVRTCRYSTARACARELRGKIVGHGVITIPAGDDDSDASDDWMSFSP